MLRGQDKAPSDAFYPSLASKRVSCPNAGSRAAPGLPRFEALTGLIYAGLSLEGMEVLAEPAIKALARECALQIDEQGGLPTRNPEELLDVFTLLTWAAAALSDAGRDAPAPIWTRSNASPRPCAPCAIPTARWRGFMVAGADRGLAGSRTGRQRHQDTATRRAVDGLCTAVRGAHQRDRRCQPARQWQGQRNAHASTLAFELTSGRRPLIVNCGPAHLSVRNGGGRGAPRRRIRTLCLDGYSSARLGDADVASRQRLLLDAPHRAHRNEPGNGRHPLSGRP